MKRKEYTMTQEEIVRALRHTCDGCNPTPCCEFEALGPEAADLIESQAAENAAYRAENERLAADLKDMRDQNQTISEKNRELRIKLDEREKNSKATQKAMLDEIAKLRNDLTAKTALLDAAIAEQETLQRAFAESQRRELAAVEMLIKFIKQSDDTCDYCKNHIECAGEQCEGFEKGVGGTGNDGTEFPDWHWQCTDFDYGTCAMLANTPCNGCFENDCSGFEWRGPQEAWKGE